MTSIYMLFGRTEKEILAALEFYDNRLEEVKKYDLTLSEAVETVYAIQKRYASGVDKNWVEVQLKSFAALGLIKFKEEKKSYASVEQTMKGNTVRKVYITYGLINHVAKSLQEKCRTLFGSCWSIDNAMILARTAITEYEFEKARDKNEKTISINFPC